MLAHHSRCSVFASTAANRSEIGASATRRPEGVVRIEVGGWPVALALTLLAVGLLGSYGNSFGVPFVFDDLPAIPGNRTIHDLTDWRSVLSPPGRGITVEGRPMLNVSLALNYAWSGTDVWSYHAVNLFIHWLGACLLFGITLRLAALVGIKGIGVGFVTALLWAVHPLQTESVTYVVQRAESLAGLWYLLGVHSFLISTKVGASLARLGWQTLSIAAFALGVLTKETVITAPIMILFLDRTLVAGSFLQAWRMRRTYYLGLLAVALGFLAWVAWAGLTRSGTAGLGTGVSPWHYFLTQLEAIPSYLRLVFWPHPLVFDYGTNLVSDLGAVWVRALAAFGAIVLSCYGFVHRRAVTLLPIAFLLLLSPSSSFLPVASQTMAEHRMYLPLAPVIMALVFAVAIRWGRLGLAILAGFALPLGWLTFLRNQDYSSHVALFEATVHARPDNARAYYNLGIALEAEGRNADARRSYQKATELDPGYADAWVNLGNAVFLAGSLREAEAHYRTALRHAPQLADAHFNLGNLLLATGETEQAIASYETALRINPLMAEARGNLALSLSQVGRKGEAELVLQRGVQLDPQNGRLRASLGIYRQKTNRLAEAVEQFEAAVHIAPANSTWRCQLAGAYLALGRTTDAEVQYRSALASDARSIEAHYGLGNVRLAVGDLAEAERYFRRASELAPDFAEARINLAAVLVRTNRISEAVDLLQVLAAQRPKDRQIHYNLGYAFAANGQIREAIAQYEHTLTLGEDVRVRINLARILAESGQIVAAEAHGRRAVELAPEHKGARILLGMLWLRTDRPSEAADLFQAVTRQHSDSVEAFYGLGLAQEMLEQWDRAAAAFEAVLRLAPNDQDAQLHLEQLRQRGFRN